MDSGFRRSAEEVSFQPHNRADFFTHFADRIHPIDLHVAEHWGRLGIRQPLSVADGLIAATSLALDLTVVTRNTADFEPHGVKVFNPFAP